MQAASLLSQQSPEFPASGQDECEDNIAEDGDGKAAHAAQSIVFWAFLDLFKFKAIHQVDIRGTDRSQDRDECTHMLSLGSLSAFRWNHFREREFRLRFVPIWNTGDECGRRIYNSLARSEPLWNGKKLKSHNEFTGILALS
jgi:hypothetical protein